MEPTEVLKNYAVKLLTLPVRQPKFIALLKQENLLPGNTESKIRAVHLTEDEAAQFLVNEIDKTLIISRDGFDKLIWVMKQYKDGGMEQLANEMESVVEPNPCMYYFVYYVKFHTDCNCILHTYCIIVGTNVYFLVKKYFGQKQMNIQFLVQK